MFTTIKKVLGIGPKVDYKVLVQNGAQIIDVRTENEFKKGHIKGSINIPLQIFQNSLSRVSKDKPAILCCASGIRSGTAKGILKSNGFADAHNGGGWKSLNNKIN